LRSVCDRIIKMVSASPSLNGRAIGEGHSKCLAYYCEAYAAAWLPSSA
jgi:hypothetical protein